MTRFRILLFLVGILLIPSSSFAYGTSTGNDLVRACSLVHKVDNGILLTLSEELDFGYCIGLIRGVSGVLNAYGLINPPEHVTSGQMAKVFLKYANENPNELADVDVAVVMEALQAVFPLVQH